MKRFWISWMSSLEDFRPLEFPPAGLLGWWCSGMTGDDVDVAILVALLDAADEEAAKQTIIRHWPEAEDMGWRFVMEKEAGWTPSDRFPLPSWSPLSPENQEKLS